MKFDFDGIQAFVAVADLGGFGKAAQQLHITQTALTRRIQKLEAYFELRLIDRTTRRMELTAVGRAFLPRARSLVEDMRLAVDDLREVSLHARGQAKLACIPSMTTHVLPRVIERYGRLYPDNRIRLFDGASDEVRDAVLGGHAELGIALQGERQADLVETPLFADPLVFICRAPHPLLGRRSVSWEDMRDARLIGVSSFTTTRVVMDYQLAKRGIRVRGDLEVRHHAAAINLVAAGVGSAILPASTFQPGDRPDVHSIPLTQPVVRRKVVLIRPRRGELSPAAQAFHDLIRQVVKAPSNS